MRLLTTLIPLLLLAPFTTQAEAPAATAAVRSINATFEAPANWTIVPQAGLPAHIHMLAMGKGKREVPPTINLASEHVEFSLKEYLKVVKEINEAEGRDWKELGTIQTRAGTASLSQVHMPTKWGMTRLLHAILVKEDTAFILTASSLEDEFTEHYEVFFQALQSLDVRKKSGV